LLLLALVRPDRAPARARHGQPGRLLVSARVRAQLSLARGARGDHGPRRARGHPLHDPRGGHHRHPLRQQAGLTRGASVQRSAVPPPVTQVLDAAQAWLPGLMARAEERLTAVVGDDGPLVDDAQATLRAGGKRLRPMLVLLCAGPNAGDSALRAAAAIELVHMATLVHDDVLDAAPLRRGLPTVVATAGREQATSVGDLLLARAFSELAAPGAERQVQLLARASVGLALGELAQRRDAFDTTISAERYLARCRLKTARLFECACLIGRASAGAPNGS